MQELKQALREGVVLVRFVKRDGTLREMRATTRDGLFSYRYKGSDVVREGVTAMWDLDANGWRSMRDGALLSWERVAA